MNSSEGNIDGGKEFGLGLGEGVALITIEFLIFVFEKVNESMPTIIASMPKSEASNQIFFNFSTLIGVFILVTIIQSLLIGALKSIPFVFGYLFGVGIFLFAFIFYVLNLIPSVVYGMAVSFLIVIACLIFRLHLKKPKYNDPWND